MAKGKDTTRAPLSASAIAERVDLARKLIALSAEQCRQATINQQHATVGLAELLVDLERMGVSS